MYKQIIQQYFNPKEYLKDLASKVSENENATAILTEALQQIQLRSNHSNVKKVKKERPVKTDQPEEI